MLEFERKSRLGCVRVRACLMEFFDDSLGELAAFAAFTSNTQLCSQISQITRTTTTKVANLIIGNLSANAYVHVLSLMRMIP